MAPLLEARGIMKRFRGLTAVDDYSLRLEAGAIAGLIGPNGAGKTTVFNVLTGVLKPTTGSVHLRGRAVTGLRPDRIAALGMARTFQNLRLFKSLTVLDNVLVGAQIHKSYGFFTALVGLPSLGRGERALRDRAFELLEALGLAGHAQQPAGSLPYGSQRKLEIARALATGPRVLLLDEPAAGMNPRESLELMETIRKVRDRFDLTILLIEHDMRVVMNLCQSLQVLSYGRIIAEGTPAEIRNNPEVVEAYLGRGAGAPAGAAAGFEAGAAAGRTGGEGALHA